MRIAVTGGNGDLGRSLIPFLLDQGHQVVSIDRALPPPVIPRPTRSAEHMVANTSDFGQFVGAIRGCDALIHLAAIRSPATHPDSVVYIENTASSYNALSAAATLGIRRVCLASSINAIGGVFSRQPRYDYFPLDEQHPTYAEDPYSLSKWVLEQQADSFARRFEDMSIASLRFHGLVADRAGGARMNAGVGAGAARHLWAYTTMAAASQACLLGITADFRGHQAFYIVAPNTAVDIPSLELAQQYYPATPIRSDLAGTRGFFDCSKAARLLGWVHPAD